MVLMVEKNVSKPVFQSKSEGGIVQGKPYPCIILEETTKKGGRKAKVKSDDSICGAIINNAAVPAEIKAGDEIELKVKILQDSNSQFEYINKE